MSMFGPPQPPMSALGKVIAIMILAVLAFAAGAGFVVMAGWLGSHVGIRWYP